MIRYHVIGDDEAPTETSALRRWYLSHGYIREHNDAPTATEWIDSPTLRIDDAGRDAAARSIASGLWFTLPRAAQ